MAPAPVFDHRLAGTPAAAWQARRAALTAGAAVGAHDHLLVVAAHPDDETLGAGGLIADAAAAGAQVTVMVATDGERSHPESSTHRPDDLATIRQQELVAAVAVLAPGAQLVMLHRPDGRLGNDVAALAAAIGDAAPDPTVVVAPWRADGHPDHEAAGRAAAQVATTVGARFLEYPVWGWHWGQPGDSGPTLDGSWVRRSMSESARAAKTAAMAAHRSQHAPLSDRVGDEAILPPDLLEHFAGPDEVFAQAAPADLPRDYFERLYRRTTDPWGLDASFYETRKRQLVMASLPRPRFASGFEPGCAIGLLTIELADRCDALLAVDVSDSAVAATARRTAGRPGVEVRRAAVPAEWPTGRFDLIVISEIGYYLSDPTELARRAHAALTDDGVLVGCHWRHPAAGYPSSAERVHQVLSAGLHVLADHIEDDFLLNVWTKQPASVARSSGLLG